MEQSSLLSQLSRDELYAIYQFLLLESRSPQEIHRNATKEQMNDILSRALSVEEAQYCLEFFENYEFYEVPVLKWEMIEALPDDLLCALHSIYLDSVDFPETHQELVDSLSQSNYFLKEDARKFYLWFHYFRLRILWEDTAAAQSTYGNNETVRYDLEEMGVADSFTMENYGDLLAEDAGLSSDNYNAPVDETMTGAAYFDSQDVDYYSEASETPATTPTGDTYRGEGASSDAYASVSAENYPSENYPSEDYPSEPYPSQEQYTPREQYSSERYHAPDHYHHGAAGSSPSYAEMPRAAVHLPFPPPPDAAMPPLTPLQQKLMASLPTEQKEVVNQTIEINSFNLEAYLLEQEELEQAASGVHISTRRERTAVDPSLDAVLARMRNASQEAPSRPVYDIPKGDGPTVIVDGPSVVVDGPSVVVDSSLAEPQPVAHERRGPPPPPPKAPPVGDGKAAASFQVDPTDPMRRSAPPPPPPSAKRQPKLSELETIDLTSALNAEKATAGREPDPMRSTSEIEVLGAEDLEDVEDGIELLEADDEEEILEAEPLETDSMEAEIPRGNRSAPPPPPKAPSNVPPPPKSKKKPQPRVPPPRASAGLTNEQLESLTRVLYRTSLLGASYARPQIRAIRIFIQKILECAPDQLRVVRDILKRLQTEDSPLVPPKVDELASFVHILPYAMRLHLVHSAIFLLGCKTLQNLERYRDFLIELSVELKLDPSDISLFDLFGIVEEEIQLGIKDCLELFGLEENAPETAIRKAHREKVRRYHPDQFHTHGPEFVRLAERKMKESNMALEILLHRAKQS